MTTRIFGGLAARLALAAFAAAVLGGCAGKDPAAESLEAAGTDYEYIIGPGDSLNIFVWRNPELSQGVTVRPDGKLTVPLVEDLEAAGKTSTALAREIEEVLSTYIKDPLVTVMVGGFSGAFSTQVRVLGEATEPTSLAYRDQMTALDVMIAVGGLTAFADGNNARLVRMVDGKQQTAVLRLEDLVKDGDITANVPMAPGDVIIIPEAWF